MIATKANFHVDAFASFAGLERKHVDAIIAAVKANKAMPQSAKRETVNGTRMSGDFAMPQDWIDWAMQERSWSPDEAKQEAASFIDYWIGVSGQKGVKADWLATWRNSVRRSHRIGTQKLLQSNLSPLEIAQSQLKTAELLGRDYEAGIARRKIAALSNVLPFKSTG
jgi:hypothetical protein